MVLWQSPPSKFLPFPNPPVSNPPSYLICEPHEKAGHFNSGFVSGPTLPSYHNLPSNYISTNHSLAFLINTTKIRQTLNPLDVHRPRGKNAILPIVLKMCVPVLALLLRHLFRISFHFSAIPIPRKYIEVFLVLKRSHHPDPNKRCPISLTHRGPTNRIQSSYPFSFDRKWQHDRHCPWFVVASFNASSQLTGGSFGHETLTLPTCVVHFFIPLCHVICWPPPGSIHPQRQRNAYVTQTIKSNKPRYAGVVSS